MVEIHDIDSPAYWEAMGVMDKALGSRFDVACNVWAESFPRGHCFVMDTHRVVYVPITKCASSTISGAIRRPPGCAVAATLDRLTSEQHSYWTFAAVRDPLERWVSSYLAMLRRYESHPGRSYLSERDPSTGGMLRLLDDIRHEGFFDVHLIPQIDFLPDRLSSVNLLRLDQLDDELDAKIWPRVGRPDRYIRRNVKPVWLRDRARSCVTDEVRALVLTYYSEDSCLWRALVAHGSGAR